VSYRVGGHCGGRQFARVAGIPSVPLTGVPIDVSGDDMEPSNGNDGGMTQTHAPSRPDPVRWLWYTLGGGIGPRYREWVVHDVTSRSRWLRQVGRTLVQAATVGALLILVLGFGWITWVSLISGLLLALMYYGVFFEAFAEHRLFQHGYPWGTAERIVHERDRRRSQIGLPADEPHSGLVMIPKRSNTATIGARQQRFGHRSLRIGQHFRTGQAGHTAPQRTSRWAKVPDLNRNALDPEFCMSPSVGRVPG
jgi:hypothetical protein